MLKQVVTVQLSSTDSVADNLNTIEAMLAQKANSISKGALIVLPENFALMGVPIACKQAIAEYDCFEIDQLEKDQVEIKQAEIQQTEKKRISSNRDETGAQSVASTQAPVQLFIQTPSQAPIQAWLSALAKKYQCYVVGGSTPMKSTKQGIRPSTKQSQTPFATESDDQSTTKVYSSCLVFNPQGQRIARYDKRHLFDVDVSDDSDSSDNNADVGESTQNQPDSPQSSSQKYRESDTFLHGSNPPMVIDINGTQVGLSICYDLRFPEHYRPVSDQPVADLWLVPSAFVYDTGKAHWLTLLKARAIENQCHMVGVNQCGEHSDGRKTWGHSLVVDDWGKVLASSTDQVEVLITPLQFDKQKARRQSFPVLQHRVED